ncbi:hypothetical protein FH966_03575 [Lentibacillus cibarius]|uniref:Uncharacterized protein n=1 Tax=Lentibacillus cibarius TaxID=2583219 RepID=A0A549YG53_9BACI|nr:hypothetical protein [Lentibacillus cibarius]TRM10872.1 hypothetical protein FH966_03575 [Lentibacillus cibarius]
MTIAIIILILFIIYVVFSLITIKYQLKLISDHLNIKDNDDKEKVSNEDIEKELENKFSDN